MPRNQRKLLKQFETKFFKITTQGAKRNTTMHLFDGDFSTKSTTLSANLILFLSLLRQKKTFTKRKSKFLKEISSNPKTPETPNPHPQSPNLSEKQFLPLNSQKSRKMLILLSNLKTMELQGKNLSLNFSQILKITQLQKDLNSTWMKLSDLLSLQN